MSDEPQTEIPVERRELRFPDDVPLMIEHLEKGWSVGGGDAVLILKGLLQMSMSDARQFAELLARVAELENRMGVVIAQIALAQADIHDHVEGRDVSDEVLGPVADEAARDGLRAILKGRRQGIGPEGNLLETPGVDYPKFEDKPKEASELDLASDPGLKDKLAALQGGESTAPKPGSARK